MKKLLSVIYLSLLSSSLIYANSLKCEKKDNRIICTYISDRSDGQKDIILKFYWISPKSPQDNREREIAIPPYYGSAYDYRFIPGRIPGKWKVIVKRDDTNETLQTFFDINATEDDFFK